MAIQWGTWALYSFLPPLFFLLGMNESYNEIVHLQSLPCLNAYIPCVGQCQSVGSQRFVSNKGYVFLPS